MPQNKVRYRWNKVSLYELGKSVEMGLSLFQLKQLKQLDIPLEKIEYVRTTNLYKTIQKKLVEREIVAQRLYNILMALKAKKYAGSPDDKITNPLAINNYGYEPLYKNIAEKRIAFELGVEDGMVAYTGFKETVPLGMPGAEFNDVEFIGGLWRVQKKFPYKVVKVRDKEFVLVKKLPRVEKNKFEYYSAATVVWGGTGCSSNVNNPDWIVAKYETPCGAYWAYGRTIEQARAFLGIELYDKHQDLIHANLFDSSEKRK